MTVPLSKNVKDYIAGLYTDCICKDCIHKIEAMFEPHI
jgi:hypothetical protein